MVVSALRQGVISVSVISRLPTTGSAVLTSETKLLLLITTLAALTLAFNRDTLLRSTHPPSVAFDNQIFRRQPRGGISRYFKDLATALQSSYNITLSKLKDSAIVHATFYGGKPYALKPEQRLVSSLFDMTPELHPEYFPLSKFRSPHANKMAWLQKSDAIISISQASADDLCFFEPALASKVEVIHLATQIDCITPEPIPHLLGRRFWVMVGKRRGYKNALTLYRALQRFNQDNRYNILLVLTGGEPWGKQDECCLHTTELRSQILPMRANDQHLAWLYRHAEAVLVPSIAEGFSLPLIEALACDTPVIASDLEAHREVAESFATLVPALNASAWAECLSACVQKQALRPSEVLGLERYKQSKDYFSVTRMADNHTAVYSRLTA